MVELNHDRIRLVEATIADLASLSAEVDIGAGYRVVGVSLPPMDATTDELGFEHATVTGGTFKPVWKTGGAARHYEPAGGATAISFACETDVFRGMRFLKVLASDGGVVDAQAADRVITLICVPDRELAAR